MKIHNYKIFENRPELTKEQVMLGVNFNVVQAGISVSGKISLLKLFSLKKLFFTGLTAVIIITGTFIYVKHFNSKKAKEELQAKGLTKSLENIKAIKSLSKDLKASINTKNPIKNKSKTDKHVQIKDTTNKKSEVEAFKKSMEESLALIESYRQRVINGESMSELAEKYSEDPGSAINGGRYNDVDALSLVPEFREVALSLKPNEVSKVFKTQYGYHFMQLIARKNNFNLIDFRHILVIPK